MNSSTTPSPTTPDGEVAVGYVLIPFLLITVIGIAAAAVMYIRRKRRIDRLRHQLLPVYTYDPAEELSEAEQEILWKKEDTRKLSHRVCAGKYHWQLQFCGRERSKEQALNTNSRNVLALVHFRLFKVGREVINSDALCCPKASTYDSSKHYQSGDEH